jgi:serine/threonine-protein kinase RsbW
MTAPDGSGGMAKGWRELRIPAELDRLVELRALVRDVAERCEAPPTCNDDLVQAVDEAATNVIVHGYRGATGFLDIAAGLIDDRIVITMADTAPLYDPTTVPEPDMSVAPERRRPGGMGVHLMRLATDELTHAPRPGGGNILTMTRRLERSPEEDG